MFYRMTIMAILWRSFRAMRGFGSATEIVDWDEFFMRGWSSSSDRFNKIYCFNGWRRSIHRASVADPTFLSISLLSCSTLILSAIFCFPFFPPQSWTFSVSFSFWFISRPLFAFSFLKKIHVHDAKLHERRFRFRVGGWKWIRKFH